MAGPWDEAIREVLDAARTHVGGNAALAQALHEVGVGPEAGTYSESAVSNWIKGRTRPPSDVILAAAVIGNQSLDQRLQISTISRNLETINSPESPSQVHKRLLALEYRFDELARQFRAKPPLSDNLPSQLPFKQSPNSFLDLKKVFSTRLEYLDALPPHDHLWQASSIDIAGLSLNLIAQQMGDVKLREMIENGTKVRCLFLDPLGSNIAARNEEEGHPPGLLGSLTSINISALVNIRNRLTESAKPRLEFKTYDQVLRFNITIIDGSEMVVQPYLPAARGLESPTFVVSQTADEPHGLFHTFSSVFEDLWGGGIDILSHDK